MKATAQEAVKSLLNAETSSKRAAEPKMFSSFFPLRNQFHAPVSAGHAEAFPSLWRSRQNESAGVHKGQGLADYLTPPRKRSKPRKPKPTVKTETQKGCGCCGPEESKLRRSAWPHPSKVYPERQAAAAPTKAVTSITRCVTWFLSLLGWVWRNSGFGGGAYRCFW